MSQYINEAFKKFRLLEDFEEFPLNPEGLDNLGSFMGQALDDESVDVYDLEAEAQEDLKKSYVGKVICDCNVCHSNIFYNKEDIVIDDEGIVNAEDECPYCMSNDGYTIIGEIKDWSPEVEDEIEDELSDDELADEPIEIEDEETEVVEESLKRKKARKLNESKKKRSLKESANLKNIRIIEKELQSDFDNLELDGYDEDARNIYITVNGVDITITKEEVRESNLAYAVFACVSDAIDDGLLEESLKLDGVKSLRGTKGLKKRPEKAGVKAIRGIGDSKISGTTLEEAVSSAKYYGVDEASTGRVAFDNIDEAMDWMADYGDWLYDANDNLVLETWGRDNNGDVVSWRVYTTKDSKDYETFSDLESAKQCVMEVSASLTESKKLTEGFEEDVINASGKYPIMLRTSDVNATNKLKKYCSKSGINSVVIPCAAIDDIVDGRDLLQKCKSADLVIIEDINRAIPDLQSILLSIVDRRNPYSVIAVYDNNYPSNIDIDSALLNRFRIYDTLAEDLNESIEDVTINTEDETMTMTTKEDGGVVVETSPKQPDEFYDDFDMDSDVEVGDEVIAPISDETEDEIMGNSEEEFSDEEIFEEEPMEEEPEEDVEVTDFDEETFDGLGESYLRRCYDNVNGYRTTQVRANNNTLIVEGVISFKSGAKKKTNFVFESKDMKNGKYIFEGYNAQINNGKPAFRLNCSINHKRVIPEALKYNYTSKNTLNESVKLSGTVRAKRK